MSRKIKFVNLALRQTMLVNFKSRGLVGFNVNTEENFSTVEKVSKYIGCTHA